MKIYYLRDNHTFRHVSNNVIEALQQIREEFDAGFTSGMLSSRDVPIDGIHAHGDFLDFSVKVVQWYKEIRDVDIGANI